MRRTRTREHRPRTTPPPTRRPRWYDDRWQVTTSVVEETQAGEVLQAFPSPHPLCLFKQTFYDPIMIGKGLLCAGLIVASRNLTHLATEFL